MTLESKHIQHYPLGGESALEVQFEIEQISATKGRVVGFKTFSNSDPLIYVQSVVDTHSLYLDEIKPILRPMSDLLREIDGEIGIVELAKIAFPDFDFSLDRGLAVYGKFEFSYNVYRHYFACSSLGELRIVPNQLDLFKYLFENHYDVYDLIGQGLAIDKNTTQD